MLDLVHRDLAAIHKDNSRVRARARARARVRIRRCLVQASRPSTAYREKSSPRDTPLGFGVAACLVVAVKMRESPLRRTAWNAAGSPVKVTVLGVGLALVQDGLKRSWLTSRRRRSLMGGCIRPSPAELRAWLGFEPGLGFGLGSVWVRVRVRARVRVRVGLAPLQ